MSLISFSKNKLDWVDVRNVASIREVNSVLGKAVEVHLYHTEHEAKKRAYDGLIYSDYDLETTLAIYKGKSQDK